MLKVIVSQKALCETEKVLELHSDWPLQLETGRHGGIVRTE